MIQYFTSPKIHCGCQKIRSVFRVLGMYNFDQRDEAAIFLSCFWPKVCSVQHGHNCRVPKCHIFISSRLVSQRTFRGGTKYKKFSGLERTRTKLLGKNWHQFQDFVEIRILLKVGMGLLFCWVFTSIYCQVESPNIQQ